MRLAEAGIAGRLRCPCCAPAASLAPAKRKARAKATRGAARAERAAPWSSKPRRIDVHHHISPRSYTEAIGPERLVNTYPGSRTAAYDWTPAMSIEDMDEGGTATAITSIYSGTHLAEHRDARRLARESNEFAARMMQDYRDASACSPRCRCSTSKAR